MIASSGSSILISCSNELFGTGQNEAYWGTGTLSTRISYEGGCHLAASIVSVVVVVWEDIAAAKFPMGIFVW